MAGLLAIKPWRTAHDGVRTDATVVENVATVTGQGELLYRPRFVFRSRDGRIVPVLSHTAEEEAAFAVGQAVPVVYPEDNPQNALIVSPAQMYLPTIVLGILGVVFFDVGWILRIVVRRS